MTFHHIVINRINKINIEIEKCSSSKVWSGKDIKKNLQAELKKIELLIDQITDIEKIEDLRCLLVNVAKLIEIASNYSISDYMQTMLLFIMIASLLSLLVLIPGTPLAVFIIFAYVYPVILLCLAFIAFLAKSYSIDLHNLHTDLDDLATDLENELVFKKLIQKNSKQSLNGLVELSYQEHAWEEVIAFLPVLKQICDAKDKDELTQAEQQFSAKRFREFPLDANSSAYKVECEIEEIILYKKKIFLARPGAIFINKKNSLPLPSYSSIGNKNSLLGHTDNQENFLIDLYNLSNYSEEAVYFLPVIEKIHFANTLDDLTQAEQQFSAKRHWTYFGLFKLDENSSAYKVEYEIEKIIVYKKGLLQGHKSSTNDQENFMSLPI